MYFKERIIGVVTYGILMLVFAFILKKNKISAKKTLIIYIALLSILAYHYLPNPGYDLERIYYTFTHYYSPMSFDGLIHLLKHTYTPTINIFYYFVSKSNFYGLAPATACIIFYSCIFSIFEDICQKNEIYGIKKTIFLIFFMSLGTYLEVITNIRAMTSFSLIVFCFYNEVYNNKKILKHIPLYFISSTVHLVGLTLTIIRFSIYPLQKKRWKLLYAILPITLVMMIYLFFTDYINQILFTKSYYKAYVSYSYLPEYILMTIMTIYIILIKILHRKYLIIDDKLKITNIFSLILLIVMIFNFNEYTFFHRIGTLHFLINLPIMGRYISLIKERNSLLLMFCVSAVVLLIAGSFGNLCGFKYFILGS